jgi:small subunit ribosomal protein S7
MPRKGPVPKRPILPDPKFGSKVLARFINKVMLRGKKSVAELITYDALEVIATRTGRDPMDIFTQALVPGASVVRRTRYRWKFVPTAVKRWRCAG